MLPQQSTLAWSIIISVLHVVAIVSTTFRLCHRLYKRQMWYDDYVVIVPLAFDCVYFVMFWKALTSKDYLRYRNNVHFFTSFMFGFVVNAIVLWFSRISLALSLARIFPRGHIARRFSLCIAVLCFVFFGTTVGLTIGLCQSSGRPWYRIDPHNCKKGPKGIPINGLVGVLADILADTVLFLAPLFVLRRVKLPARERRMILAAFSGSVLTLLAAVVFGVFWYCRVKFGSPAGKVVLRLVVAHIETTVAMIVCNLLLITMFLYRIFRRIHSVDSAPKHTPLAAHAVANPAPPPVPLLPLPSDSSNNTNTSHDSGDATSVSRTGTGTGTGTEGAIEDPKRIVCVPSEGDSGSMLISRSSVLTPIVLTQLDTAGMEWDMLDAPMTEPERSSALTLALELVPGCTTEEERGVDVDVDVDVVGKTKMQEEYESVGDSKGEVER
ncbi:hypothetical protein JR316_0007346 [Psilocybe cubensis]|uniref:Uncharacterized protein n=2 Tax=Psilocybe cubensis TaxID=181762 RepID=A0ACB8GZU4_PSICU|nr:hypothetical protein JR316_0007346 [Psilocybe cubensis]KAH9480746.1 hypothetical protein JR316_0007346 [Psilocybe cubensis]